MENQLQQKDIELMQKSISDLAKTVSDGFHEIRSELKIMRDNYVSMVYLKEILEYRDRELETVKKELAALQDNQKWVVRAIIGIVITALVTGLFITKTF